MLVTVFTPTYNRAHLIGTLYESLCRQSFRDFEWLVVDDGSTDHTEAFGRKTEANTVRSTAVYRKRRANCSSPSTAMTTSPITHWNISGITTERSKVMRLSPGFVDPNIILTGRE